ncbi:hypothetical protein [Promicromonospora sp. NPDC057488]|uniref:hypothetical protein n=1 Tax=Promicromonospora sp. NPDC057488 TaxID=3346147 RepID=UPI00366F2974
MNEHQRPEDQAFDRLTAADPARRAPGPADDVLRAKVDALIAGSGGRLPGPAATEPPAPAEPAAPSVDELAMRRHRRRTPWLVAAAVAGVVAVGGGGYLLGESGPGALPAALDSGTDTGAAPEAREDGPSVMGAPDESGAEAESVEPLTAGGDLDSATRLVFHAGVGLTDTPGTAEVRTAAGESLGEYPVVSEEAAVERLGDPRFAGTAPSARQAAPDGDAGPSPAPGGPIAWPVQDVTIVSAELTEVGYTLPDGAVLVVPAYDLADAAGSSWTVLAVDEEALDFAP